MWRLGKRHRSVLIQMSRLEAFHRNVLFLTTNVYHKMLVPSHYYAERAVIGRLKRP